MLYQSQGQMNITNQQLNQENPLLNSQSNYFSNSLYNQYHAPIQEPIISQKNPSQNQNSNSQQISDYLQPKKNEMDLNIM